MKEIQKYFQGHKDTYFAAEIGNNHMGRLDKALELVDLAKIAQADAVKFQFITPELLVNKTIYPERVIQLKNICLDLDDLIKVRAHCLEIGIEFGVSIFDLEGVQQTKTYLDPDFVKIASSDFMFHELISEVFENFENVIISSGMASLGEIENFYKTFSEHIGNLVFCYCVSLYPAKIEDLNLYNILHIKSLIDDVSKKSIGNGCNIKLGYSDHSDDKNAIVTSFSLGCSFLEKHFTDDKFNEEFRDHNLSSTCNEMTDLIQELQMVVKSLGRKDFYRTEDELLNVNQLRRSAYYSNNKNRGDRLSRKDIIFLRPQDPSQKISIDDVESKILDKNVLVHSLVQLEELADDKK